jgi:hypothetical protein
MRDQQQERGPAPASHHMSTSGAMYQYRRSEAIISPMPAHLIIQIPNAELHYDTFQIRHVSAYVQSDSFLYVRIKLVRCVAARVPDAEWRIAKSLLSL